jgi:Ca2+-binding EF-hand superfamily protein
MAPPRTPALDDVEKKLKHIVNERRIRVSEFFRDFDPLRSGYITKGQFVRCMSQNLGLPLTDEEFGQIADKYIGNEQGMVNYPLFIGTIQLPFNPHNLDGKPNKQIEVLPKFPTDKTTPLSNQEKVKELLEICAAYYKSRGITIRSSYEDFDRHNKGYITLSQFHRSFPGPPEVSESEIALLAQSYYDPVVKLYNYFHFGLDIKSIWEQGNDDALFSIQNPSSPVPQPSDIDDILQKIRDAVYKYGIRTTEFFFDHDKFRSGIITRNQFNCGLSASVSQRAHLTQEEIDKVADHFSLPDGNVKYKAFCDIMENAYTEADLEKKPTQTIERPLRGHLYEHVNTLTEEEEIKLEHIMEDLKTQTRKRRLLLYPYFTDFDKKKGFTRGVTKAQFERILHFLSLYVSPEGLELIEMKFQNPLNGDIKYSAFVQAIDEEYTGQVAEDDQCLSPRQSQEKFQSAKPSQEYVDIRQLILRLKEHVFVSRLRLCEYFQDFDPLRSGFVTNSRFRQGLNAIRYPYFTEAQISALCDCYSVKPDSISWKQFVKDIDEVFSATPTQASAKPELPILGSVDFTSRDVEEHQREILQATMSRLKDIINQKRLLIKPYFQDFDKHHYGYITKPQFRQCLSYLELSISDDEFDVLSMKYCNKKGFNYAQFIEDLQPKEIESNKYVEHIQTVKADRMRLEVMQNTFDTSLDPVDIMNKIKNKVVKERIRVIEFMKDYDKLRSGRISSILFHRALDMCGFGLNTSEVKALASRYASSKDEDFVDYVAFTDEIESVFTMNELEKVPTADVFQFIPPDAVDENQLDPFKQQTLENCLRRLADKVM